MTRFTPFVLMLCILLAAGTASASSELLTNGSFQSGDLTGWTAYTTTYGTNGTGLPAVASWPLGGANAAQFNVGTTHYPFSWEGGGLTQSFLTAGGTVNLTLDWAVTASWTNYEGGNFELLLDGYTLDSYNVSQINVGQTDSGVLSAVAYIGAGTHTFGVLIDRPYFSCTYTSCGPRTPDQFVTAASVIGNPYIPPTPEPGTLVLLGSGLLGGLGLLRRKLGN